MTANDPPPMSTPRVAAGAVFHDNAGRTLLVKPTYKEGWDIPGGYVEPGETPSDACAREIREELSLELPPGPLLVVDWAPMKGEGDKVLFVFDGGRLAPADIASIRLAPDELGDFQFFRDDELPTVLNGRLARRIRAAVEARAAGLSTYLEHGSPLINAVHGQRM